MQASWVTDPQRWHQKTQLFAAAGAWRAGSLPLPQSYAAPPLRLFALGYFIVYLMGTFVLQEVCTEQGHDNLSPQQAQQAYGNDHACRMPAEQNSVTAVMLVWNIVTAVVAIVGGGMAGFLFKEFEESDEFDDGSTEMEFDAK